MKLPSGMELIWDDNPDVTLNEWILTLADPANWCHCGTYEPYRHPEHDSIIVLTCHTCKKLQRIYASGTK